MSEKLTEEDTKRLYITPQLENAGWKNLIKMEYHITEPKNVLKNNKINKSNGKFADYLLRFKDNVNQFAVLEAKSYDISADKGIQQAIEYTEMLNLPYAFSSNGRTYIEHDFIKGTENEYPLSNFPTVDELMARYKNSVDENTFLINTTAGFYSSDFKRTPRYYQLVATKKVLDAIINKKQNRILLVMATGTGKTFTIFQIINFLIKNKIKRRVLYLADRNILIDQTMCQDFKPFQKIMTKIEKRKMSDEYQIYMSLYQQLISEDGEEKFRYYDKDFFDLIVIDECHRGSVKDDSLWRKILEYFDSATQIGLTATPKETKTESNISYFGEPIYEYSLSNGINDGFLAPYIVIREVINVDAEGYVPYHNERDDNGKLIENREYNSTDFDRKLIIDERTQLVAREVTRFLKESNDRYQKTIVFCVDIDHAERMRRALINENNDLVKENAKYVMKITGDDKEGKDQLDNFIDPNETYPVIVTTSKLLTTGVDCKTCKLIVLDTNIESMTEFKQIIGRGTRLYPERNKEFFTIMDFRGATRKFSDPNFDGEPICIKEINNIHEKLVDNDVALELNNVEKTQNNNEKYKLSGKNVYLINQTTKVLNSDGKLEEEKYIDYTKNIIISKFPDFNAFIKKWIETKKKSEILNEFDTSIDFSVLKSILNLQDIDDFDLINNIAYNIKPLTKSERIKNPKLQEFLKQQTENTRKVLNALLDAYLENGIIDLENPSILNNEPFRSMGSPSMIIHQWFGGLSKYNNVLYKLEDLLFSI